MSMILYSGSVGPVSSRSPGVAAAASPISRLPVEVLREIFKFSVLTDQGHHRSPRCAVLSHVNRIWRTVALSDPSLWAYISTDCGRWIEVLLERSATRPISFRMDIDYPAEAALTTLDQVFSQAFRLQEIDIYHSIESDSPERLDPEECDKLRTKLISKLRQYFLLPMPMLRVFNLLVDGHSGELITLGETPNIRSMKIAGGGLSPQSPSLERLVYLEIRLYVNIPLDALSAALATMTNLSDLRIMYPHICEHSVFPASPRVITLPRLKTFTFVACPSGYEILKYFTIDSPVLDCLELGVMGEWPDYIETCSPSKILPKFLPMIQLFPSSRFQTQGLTIHLTTAGLFTFSLACWLRGLRKIVYQAYDVNIASLYKLLPIHDVHCLTLKEDDDECMDHECLFDIFDGLKSLKEIRLFDPKHLYILSALMNKHPTRLSSLTHLVLKFRHCEEHFTWLQQILARRPLKRLTLLNSKISWTKVILLHHQHHGMEIRIWPPMNSSFYAHEVFRNGSVMHYYDTATNIDPNNFALGPVYDEPESYHLDRPNYDH